MDRGKVFNLFFLSSGEPSSYRFLRIKEEVEQRRMVLRPINIFRDFVFTEEGLINLFSGEALIFSSGELFWFFSNVAETHYAIRILNGKRDGVSSSLLKLASRRICFGDKFYTSKFLFSVGVAIPKSTLLVSRENIEEQSNLIGGFPCVLKIVSGSEGEQVSLVNTSRDVVESIKESLTYQFDKKIKLPNFSAIFLLQEYISEAKGSDYRVLCLDGEILGGIKRTSQTDDFRANVSLGGKAEAFEVPKELAEICLKIMKEGNLFYAGLDFIWSEKRGWLAIEINTCAQFKGFEKATGINVAGKIVDKLLERSQ